MTTERQSPSLEGDELFQRLKREIATDWAPVRPLAGPSLRALWLIPVWSLVASLVVTLFGARPDANVLGTWRMLGFSLAQIAVCVALLRDSLQRSIPAMAAPGAWMILWASGALLVHVVVSWSTLTVSPLTPSSGQDWSSALACLSAITLMSLAPLLLGAALLLQGLLTRPLPAFALIGLASGLVVEAAWRLHCPYSNWGHVLPFHSGTLLLPVLLALGIATRTGRRASSLKTALSR